MQNLKKQHCREAFLENVGDILQNPEYQKLGEFKHHSSSILDHCLQVGYLSYQIGRHLGMDTAALARGGVLHDFFLYDWRSDRFRCSSWADFKNSHAFRHPKIALQNAENYFDLSKREKDIILHHMWPATIIPPHYKEAYLVCAVDKYTACQDYLTKVEPKVSVELKKMLQESGIFQQTGRISA